MVTIKNLIYSIRRFRLQELASLSLFPVLVDGTAAAVKHWAWGGSCCTVACPRRILEGGRIWSGGDSKQLDAIKASGR